MKGFKIVEYDPSYAAAVADMWNKSGDSWGGYNKDTTEDAVRQTEMASVYVNLYLAIVEDEVVGYCKIAKWTEGEGALYVVDLNVRPDYHGKKIGKALMQKSVLRTAELNWPRLDLDTWPGNTKAVPLYKKTGFFWEERDREVYLVNFIPGVLKNELIKDFFDKADWYIDSVRRIEIKPDGREENKFTYFTYNWKKDGRKLLMEFARRGRGLRKVETDDFVVEVTVENLNLVFGKKYKVRYDFINKTTEPLEITIKGLNDKNITFDFNIKDRVIDTLSVEGNFLVGEIQQEQSKWKTHPGVLAKIGINGKHALFKVGIVPQFPANIGLERMDMMPYAGVENIAYLNIESNLNENATFTFSLPGQKELTFKKYSFSVDLKPKKRKSIEVPYILHNCCIYSKIIEAKATLENGEVIIFKREVGMNLFLHAGTYHGKMVMGNSEKAYVMGNGAYAVYLMRVRDTHINEVRFLHGYTEQPWFFFQQPKLGMPLSEEFIKKQADKISFYEENGSITMKVLYASDDFKGIKITVFFCLHASGILERWHEVQNTGKSETDKEIVLYENFCIDLNRSVIPYKGKFIETRDETGNFLELWKNTEITENWVFSKGNEGTIGVCWDKDERILIQGSSLAIEHKVGRLASDQKYTTKPVTALMNTFTDWHKFRQFAFKKYLKQESLTQSLEFQVNEGNPFTYETVPVKIIEHQQKNLDGTITIFYDDNHFSKSVVAEDKLKMVDFSIPIPKKEKPVLITLDAKFNVLSFSRKKAIFPIQNKIIKTKTEKDNGHEVFIADNGIICIKSAPSFAPNIYSCTYRGKNWVHSSFPQIGPKDWWNPWIGGLYSLPSDMDARPLLKEKTSASFVEKEDTCGNKWKGILVHIIFTEHEKFKGLDLKQYYLLLPGVPLLFYQVEIFQNTGKFFNRQEFSTEIFTLPDEDMKNASFMFKNKEFQSCEISSGRENVELQPPTNISIIGKKRNELLIVVHNKDKTRRGIMGNKTTTALWFKDRIVCPDGERCFVPPKFFVFSDYSLEDEWLEDLRNIELCN